MAKFGKVVLFFIHRQLILLILASALGPTSGLAEEAKNSDSCSSTLKIHKDWSKLQRSNQAQKIWIHTENGGRFLLSTQNYTLMASGDFRKSLPQVTELLARRSAQEQSTIDEKLTRQHALNEMSFQVKDPQTGFYDRTQAVPSHGVPALISEQDFNEIYQSTGPVMRALRRFLQKLYSTPSPTAEDLEIDHLPPEIVETVFTILKDNIYFQKALVAPQMKDYPFLTMAGFDGAIGDPSHPLARFYEMNLGTPSGISNNILLLERLFQIDPDLRHALLPHLPPDKTYELINNDVTSNGEAWTRRTDGLTVIVSPGHYNGAHPDVVMINQMAGTPLVRPQDLYQDKDGWIRLNTGAMENNPIVTTALGRSEESYFLQSNEDGIPMISPFYMNNKALGEKLGLSLRNGVVYRFQYNSEGQIEGVEQDEEGNPIFERVYDQIGLDPTRPDAPRGSFAQALLQRKFYYSALGGRVADDKRLFSIISEYLAPRFRRGEKRIAAPIPHLAPGRYHEFYQHPDNYVVKEPNNSGGAGNVFMPALPEREKQEVIERVKENPQYYVIQPLTEATTVTAVNSDSYQPVATDLRFFVTLDAQGNVHAGPQALLLRTAKPQSLSSNTSLGGGYGIGVIYRAEATSPPHSFELPHPTLSPLPLLQREELKEFIENLNDLTQMTDQWGSPTDKKQKEAVSELVIQMRSLMHLLPRSTFPLMTALRQFTDVLSSADEAAYSQKKEAKKQLNQSIHQIRRELLNPSVPYQYTDLPALVRQGLSKYYPLGLSQSPSHSLRFVKYPTRHLITSQKLNQPLIVYEETRPDGQQLQKVLVEEYTQVDRTEINQVLVALEAAGVKVLKPQWQFVKEDGEVKVSKSLVPPFFWVINSADPRLESVQGVPVVAIDLEMGGALNGLYHEYRHVQSWLKIRNQYLDQGLSETEANIAAQNDVLSTEHRLEDEKQAIHSEILATLNFPTSPFATSTHPPRPIHYYEPGYVNRIAYPEFEAVRNLLHLSRWDSSIPLETDQILIYMKDMIQTALINRRKAIQHYKKRIQLLEKQLDSSDTQEELVRDAQYMLEHFLYKKPHHMLMYPYGVERLQQNDTSDLFRKFYEQALSEMDLDDLFLKKDPMRSWVDFIRQKVLSEQNSNEIVVESGASDTDDIGPSQQQAQSQQ